MRKHNKYGDIMCHAVLSHSLMSNYLWPHGLQPTKLLCPWRFSRQDYWSGLSFPPPGDLPNSGGLNPGLLHCRQILYHLSHQGSPAMSAIPFFAFLVWYLAEGGSVAHWLLWIPTQPPDNWGGTWVARVTFVLPWFYHMQIGDTESASQGGCEHPTRGLTHVCS